MPLRLVHSTVNRPHLSDHPVSRLRLASRRRAAPPACADDRVSGLAFSEGEGSDEPVSQGLVPDEHGPDAAAMRVLAEEEDLALVRAAAAKLAAALREVRVLLGRRSPGWKRDALARCSAKGWIQVQGDPLTEAQIFRVTAEGYRAAGLPVPPFGA